MIIPAPYVEDTQALSLIRISSLGVPVPYLISRRSCHLKIPPLSAFPVAHLLLLSSVRKWRPYTLVTMATAAAAGIAGAT